MCMVRALICTRRSCTLGLRMRGGGRLGQVHGGQFVCERVCVGVRLRVRRRGYRRWLRRRRWGEEGG